MPLLVPLTGKGVICDVDGVSPSTCADSLCDNFLRFDFSKVTFKTPMYLLMGKVVSRRSDTRDLGGWVSERYAYLGMKSNISGCRCSTVS